MKAVHSSIALCLFLAACGNDDAEKRAEALAAIETLRPEYESREARVVAAIDEAQKWRGLGYTIYHPWGDRPEARFLDVRQDKFGKKANGCIFELTAEGKLNTDPASMLGLFVETAWRDDIADKMTGEGHLTKGGVEAAFEAFKAVRYLCLLISDEFKPAEFGSGTLFSINFKPGSWRGRASYHDLEDGKFLGIREIRVENSSKIEFKTEGFDEAEQLKRGQQAATEDLRKLILEAAGNPPRR